MAKLTRTRCERSGGNRESGLALKTIARDVRRLAVDDPADLSRSTGR